MAVVTFLDSCRFLIRLSRLSQDVRVIVENALRLFSQDRTGLADYALESGGEKRSS